MFRSLRFRIPALFLAGILVALLVASLIAVRLFQNYTRDVALTELRAEARGLAQLYAAKAGDLPTSTRSLEEATGARLYYSGLEVVFGSEEEASVNLLPRLPREAVPTAALQGDGQITFEFTPPGESRVFLAVAEPLSIEGHVFGALVVAKPRAELRDQWMTLLERLSIAFLVGVVVAGALAWYLGRRVTKPVLALSKAADAVASGQYDVALPTVKGGDEIAHLSERFAQMAERLRQTEALERNFLTSVSHELRT